jgi:hypothetical protein
LGNVESAVITRHLLAAAILVAFSPAAFADKKSEAFVETNANAVLRVLNNASLTNDQRKQKFAN